MVCCSLTWPKQMACNMGLRSFLLTVLPGARPSKYTPWRHACNPLAVEQFEYGCRAWGLVDFFVVMKKWCLFDFKCSYLTSTFTYNFWSFITEGIVMDYMFLVEELLFFFLLFWLLPPLLRKEGYECQGFWRFLHWFRWLRVLFL